MFAMKSDPNIGDWYVPPQKKRKLKGIEESETHLAELPVVKLETDVSEDGCTHSTSGNVQQIKDGIQQQGDVGTEIPAVKLEIDDLIDGNNRQVEERKEDLLQQDSTKEREELVMKVTINVTEEGNCEIDTMVTEESICIPTKNDENKEVFISSCERLEQGGWCEDGPDEFYSDESSGSSAGNFRPSVSSATLCTMKYGSEEPERQQGQSQNQQQRNIGQQSQITVKTTSNERGRQYDKKYLCFYCAKPLSKLPVHLQNAHPNEAAVADWLQEKNPVLKSTKLTKLRNLGNHIHNSRVLEKGQGELIVRYRPSVNCSAADFVPCPVCYGYFSRKTLSRHSCPLKKEITPVNGWSYKRSKHFKSAGKSQINKRSKICLKSGRMLLPGKRILHSQIASESKVSTESAAETLPCETSQLLHDASRDIGQSSGITVKTTSNNDGRRYDKKFVCYFCEEPKSKLHVHLRNAHSNEPAVMDWMKEEDKKLKLAKLTKLRNLGNHIENCRVLKKGQGELLVKYRPSVSCSAADFVPCPVCYGYFNRKSLQKHSCPLKKVVTTSSGLISKRSQCLKSAGKGQVKKRSKNRPISQKMSPLDLQILPSQSTNESEVSTEAGADVSPSSETPQLCHDGTRDIEKSSGIIVKTTSNEDGRKFDKKYTCFFCDKPKSKLPVHLRNAHSNEPAVMDWMEEKNKKLKSAKLTKLRNLGNHIQNCRVLESGQGEIIVRYRPKLQADPTNFVPCPNCYGYFAKNYLWKHSCPLEEFPDKNKGSKCLRGKRVKQGTMLLPSSIHSESQVEKFLSKLQDDDISRCIKGDELLCKFASKELKTLGSPKKQQNHEQTLRTKLRAIARLLIEVRSECNEPDSYLLDFIDPAKYGVVVSAVRTLAGFDSRTQSCSKLRFALKVGYGIKKCTMIVTAEAVKSGNQSMVRQSTKFLEILEMKWTEDFGCHTPESTTLNITNMPESLCHDGDLSSSLDNVKQVDNEEATRSMEQKSIARTSKVDKFSKHVDSDEETCWIAESLGELDKNEITSKQVVFVSEGPYPVSISKVANEEKDQELATKDLVNTTNTHVDFGVEVDLLEGGMLSPDVSTHSPTLHAHIKKRNHLSLEDQGTDSQEEPTQTVKEQSCGMERSTIDQNKAESGKRMPSKITVMTTSNDKRRKYDKRYICYFCGESKCKLPVHFQHAHLNESAVIDWLMEKDQNLKLAKLAKLRNLGNHIQNCRVLERGKGKLIVKYRPKMYVDPTSFVPCPFCYGYFSKKYLWSHTCPLEKVTTKEKGERETRSSRLKNGIMLLPSSKSSKSAVKQLLSTMKNDDVLSCIKSDELILAVARKEATVIDHDKEQQNQYHIRYRLREIGRFLKEAQLVSNEPMSNLSDFIDSARYDTVTTAVKNLAGFDVQTLSFKVPSLALKIGQSLKKCALVMKAKGLESGDGVIVNKATRFYKLMETRWNTDIADHAHRSLIGNKMPKSEGQVSDSATGVQSVA